VYVPFEPPLDVEAVAVSAHEVLVRWQTDAPIEADQIFTARFWAPDGTDLFLPESSRGTELTSRGWGAGRTLVVRVASCGVESGRCGPWIPEAGVSVTLPEEDTRSVAGRITRDGAPVGGAIVMAFTPTDTWVGSTWATTAADGTYTLDRLGAASTYRILAVGPEGSSLEARWYPGTGRRAEAIPVDTTAGSVTGIDIDWPDAPGISGVVTGPGGSPLAGARVTAYRPTDRYIGTVAVTTAADGSYSIDRLDPGTYLLLVQPRAGSGVVACWHAGVLKRADATPVSFTGVPRPGIDTTCPAP
jgi:hypothetical protein